MRRQRGNVLLESLRRWPQAALSVAVGADRLAGALRVPVGPPSIRERTLWRAMEAGCEWPYPRIVGESDLPTLAPPMVLVTAHVGSMLALGALLERLSAEILVLHASYPARPGLVMNSVAGASEVERAGAFRQAVLMLRAGGFVLIAADGDGQRRVTADILRHRVPLASGPFALARIANVPLVPVAAYWPRRRIEIVVGAPIPLSGEAEMAAAFAAWLDENLRRRPKEARPTIELVRRSPLAGDVQQGPPKALMADLPVLCPGD